MQYLLLIYQNEAEVARTPEVKNGQLHQEYMKFTDSITKSGHFQAGQGLQPTTTATTVRVRNGKRLVTDGPFAETKEALAGYYLVEAKDLDEAITLAERIPSARWGSIEVRPPRVA